MNKYIENIRNDLFLLSDEKYKDFQSALIPTVEKDLVLGVRTPVLRSYAKKLFKSDGYEPFLRNLPHRYYDENNLHSFLICQIKDFDLCISEVEAFLPYIDNWAVCDSLRPACFAGNKERLLLRIYEWLNSEEPYTVRFAIEMLMCHFLDEDFSVEHLKIVSEIKSDEYYVNMMIAWYFATALSKQYDEAVTFVENKSLPVWTHNKTIQKAIESFRILPDKKEHLRGFKIKN